MNRRERRSVQKRMGILKYKNSLSLKDRFERLSENILEGKKKEIEMKEIVRLQKEGKQDQIEQNKISSMATELMVKEGLSLVQATEKAKELYKQQIEKLSDK